MVMDQIRCKWTALTRARRMDLVFVYKVTKYDPADWGENGYGGDADTDSDYGPVEQAYIDTVQAFASEAGVSSLTIRDPGHHDGGRVRGASREPDPLDGILPEGREAVCDGCAVDLAQAGELVRLMLRSENFWCR